MKYPQTRAEKISKNINAIANYSCLAMSYLYCLGIDGSEYDYIGYVSDAMDLGLLDNECTVLDANKYLNHFAGESRFVVTKKSITNISEIEKATPVRFDYQNHSHWVVVENGKIVFNSLVNSVCVTKGKPTTARIIELRK